MYVFREACSEKITYIMNNWPVFWKEVKKALPEDTANLSHLEASYKGQICDGGMTVWLGSKHSSKEEIPKLILITSYIFDPIQQMQAMLICCLVSIKSLTKDEWQESAHVLKNKGKMNGCRSIVGYTNEPAIEKLIKFLGGRVDSKLVVLSVFS